MTDNRTNSPIKLSGSDKLWTVMRQGLLDYLDYTTLDTNSRWYPAAVPTKQQVADTGKQLLLKLTPDLPLPLISPTVSGELVFNWVVEDIRLEAVVFYKDSTVFLTYATISQLTVYGPVLNLAIIPLTAFIAALKRFLLIESPSRQGQQPQNFC